MIFRTNYDMKDFSRDVLMYSHKIPVLVDYWAEWCEPCKYLDPIVEKLAEEADGKWKLVKVNTEDNKAIAAEWGIRGVPNLKLFYKGEVIDEVAGAMPEEDLKEWLAEKLPSKAKVLTMEAAKLFVIGRIEQGVLKLEEALIEDKSLEQAKLLLARQKIWSAPEEIADLLNGIQYLESAKEILLIAEAISMKKSDFKDEASKDDVLSGLGALRKQDIGMALEHLIQAVNTNRSYYDELAKRLVIALFHYLGESNEVTRTFRRQFDMALY